MAKLSYTHGAMNSGKSIEVLKVVHNYEEQCKEVLLLTSAIDTRTGTGVVSSRIGLSQEADVIFGDTNVFDLVMERIKELGSYEDLYAVVVDESQFLNREQVIQLAHVVDRLGIPVLCYGLKNDFSNHLFEGSKALIEFADRIHEVRTVCLYCDRKAGFNLRISDGRPVYEGEQIQIGGNESYIAVCRNCYFNPPIRRGSVIRDEETIEDE